MNLKALLWRVVYVVILVLVLSVVFPLLFSVMGVAIPGGAAMQLLQFCFAALVVLYVLFGPVPPAVF